MTAEELEELLSPKRNTVELPVVPPPIPVVAATGSVFRTNGPIVASTSSYIAGGFNVTQNLGVTFNRFQESYNSYPSYGREFTEEEKVLLRNAILNEINRTAMGIRFDERELRGLSVRLGAFIEAYLYNRFSYMRNPKIECNFNLSQLDDAAEYVIIINDERIANIGVRTSRGRFF